MIQMEYDGRIAYLFGFDSQVEHPFSELPVLSAAADQPAGTLRIQTGDEH